MHHDVKTTAKWLGKVVDGWLNYFAVPTSFRYLYRFVLRLKHLWLRMLRRRSQRDRSGWARVAKLTATPLAQADHPTPVAGPNDSSSTLHSGAPPCKRLARCEPFTNPSSASDHLPRQEWRSDAAHEVHPEVYHMHEIQQRQQRDVTSCSTDPPGLGCPLAHPGRPT